MQSLSNGKKGFTIICKNCGNTIDVFDGMTEKEYGPKKFSFWPIQSERINIRCECNEVFIEEG